MEAFFQKHSWRACFPNISQFLFSRCKLCLRYTTGNFNENPSMRALEKNLRARTSEHLSNFCEQFEQRLNFASTFKLDGTIRYPLYLQTVLIKQPDPASQYRIQISNKFTENLIFSSVKVNASLETKNVFF